MSSITLKSLRHSYLPNPQSEEDYALRKIDLTWRDGGRLLCWVRLVVAKQHY